MNHAIVSCACSLAAVISTAFVTGVAGAADIKDRNIKLPIVNALEHPQGLGAKKFTPTKRRCCRTRQSRHATTSARWHATWMRRRARR
jgi:hypothetical protein